MRTNLSLNGLTLITPNVIRDNRGYFYESYSKKLVPEYDFVQANHVLSLYGTIRGLHYQNVTKNCVGQAKLVRATKGAILDVAVDIRRDSPTLGKSFKLILSEDNRNQLLIPVGFAHGYVVLSDIAEIQYLCSNYYDSVTESGILWNDKDLNIDWPKLSNIILSDRDMKNKTFAEYLDSDHNR